MAFWRFAISFGGVLAVASVSSAGGEPDRSGEVFLRTLFSKQGQGVHVRISRERKGPEDPTFTAEHVSELWVDREGRFRFERADMWGDARLIVNDGKRLVVDDLDGLPSPAKKGWKGLGSVDELHGLLGGALSAVHLLAMGDRAFDDLVDKVSDVRDMGAGRSQRVISFESTRLGSVKVFIEPWGRAWRVVQVDAQQDGSITRDHVHYLPFDGKGRFDTASPSIRLEVPSALQGLVAQRLERAAHNRLVVGSIPTGPTLFLPGS